MGGDPLLKFCKYQGTGNDFIIVKQSEIDGVTYSSLAKNVCDRRFGIGADGMIVVAPSTVADIRMIFYNADGSIATMCGNGIRCFAKYVYDHGLVGQTSFSVETLAGVLTVELVSMTNEESNVRVNMGCPCYVHPAVPKVTSDGKFINQTIELEGEPYTISSLFIGTIHTVMFVSEIDEKMAIHLGELIENHAMYPQKTNVNFCRVIDPHHIEVLTWEKGVGLTLACGTGSAACAVLSRQLYQCDQSITVSIKGGTLLMEQEEDGVYMTGPARLICTGQYVYGESPQGEQDLDSF